MIDAGCKQAVATMSRELDDAHHKNHLLCQDFKNLEKMLLDLEKAYKQMTAPSKQKQPWSQFKANISAVRTATKQTVQRVQNRDPAAKPVAVPRMFPLITQYFHPCF
jgi:hypothetical protein